MASQPSQSRKITTDIWQSHPSSGRHTAPSSTRSSPFRISTSSPPNASARAYRSAWDSTSRRRKYAAPLAILLPQQQKEARLTDTQDAITDLIMERFDRAQTRAEDGLPIASAAVNTSAPPRPPPPTTTNGVNGQKPSAKRKSSDDEEDDNSDNASSVGSSAPAPKKIKKSQPPKSTEFESDEMLAARLQAEFNAASRSTRGASNPKKRTPAKKASSKPKKKSAAKIRAEDDSDLDLDDDGIKKPEPERKGGFHKPMNLSPPLAALLGEPVLSRPQTVKKIWEYVKARDLQDPSDKRWIRCDDALHAVFKSERIHMFTMNKVLATQLYPVDEAE